MPSKETGLWQGLQEGPPGSRGVAKAALLARKTVTRNLEVMQGPGAAASSSET